MLSRVQNIRVCKHALKLTCTLGEVGNVSVVEDHLIFQHVCQSTQTRATNDAHHWAHCSLSQQPVSCSPAILIAVPEHNTYVTYCVTRMTQSACAHTNKSFSARHTSLAFHDSQQSCIPRTRKIIQKPDHRHALSHRKS